MLIQAIKFLFAKEKIILRISKSTFPKKHYPYLKQVLDIIPVYTNLQSMPEIRFWHGNDITFYINLPYFHFVANVVLHEQTQNHTLSSHHK